jgi:hypothetical protein
MTVLKSSVSADYTDNEKEEQCDMLKYVLGSLVASLHLIH